MTCLLLIAFVLCPILIVRCRSQRAQDLAVVLLFVVCFVLVAYALVTADWSCDQDGPHGGLSSPPRTDFYPD